MAVHDLENMKKQKFLDGYFTSARKIKKAAPEKCKEITACIAAVADGDEREFLYRRYIRVQQMEAIAGLMNMSRASVYRLQNRALENIKIPGKDDE